jgi:carbamoyltransferase
MVLLENPKKRLRKEKLTSPASIQAVTEEIVLKMAKFAREETGKSNLCLSGGVALNCVANGKLQASKIFDNIWIQPASGDAGGALGAALFTNFQLLKRERIVNKNDSMKGSYLGPRFENEEISNFKKIQGPSHFFPNEDELLDKVCDAIEDEKIVGWFQGRMEFGPRALGGRSIIGDARSEKTQTQMNLSIKYRESFRPFAPSVLEEKSAEYFELDTPSPTCFWSPR